MTLMTLSRQSLLQHLVDEFGLDAAGIDDATLLFSDGLLDSFAVADLLTYIEEQGAFTVQPHEVTLDNLDSIERILAFANSKAG